MRVTSTRVGVEPGWGSRKAYWLWKGNCFLRGKRFPQEYRNTAVEEVQGRERDEILLSTSVAFWSIGRKNLKWDLNCFSYVQCPLKYLLLHLRWLLHKALSNSVCKVFILLNKIFGQLKKSMRQFLFISVYFCIGTYGERLWWRHKDSWVIKEQPYHGCRRTLRYTTFCTPLNAEDAGKYSYFA